MARIPVPSKVIRGFQYVLENDFTGGLKTEFTGLNFPENACTSTENCTFFHTGAVFRRNGFDQELNSVQIVQDRTNLALSTFVWTNAGGDGNQKLFVTQTGAIINFYNITAASVASPLSSWELGSTVLLTDYSVGGLSPGASECQYAAGNGYLFIFNTNADSIVCTYSGGAITSTRVDVQIRDFVGIPESTTGDAVRPFTLSAEHNYNLQNQGWTSAVPWTATSNTLNLSTSGGFLHLPIANDAFTVAAGIAGVVNGTQVSLKVSLFRSGVFVGSAVSTGSVFSYAGTTLTITVSSSPNEPIPFNYPTGYTQQTVITPANPGGNITTWFTAINNYPSNSDIWWQFKNSTGVFPSGASLVAQLPNVSLGGPAPKGSYILDAFTQQRSGASGVASLTDVTTNLRPRTGAWFQGRVWFSGVDDSFAASGDMPYSTWTENIYFSQIAIDGTRFGRCYQTNDPTDETLFDILPSDGGVITIQGSGSIYKLFPITNGLLVFAANGIWFISGSTGIGFTATDYTVSKVSAVQNIAGTSYIDVLGYPIFWNEEGIYMVGMESGQQGLTVNSISLNSIKQFYDAIPLQSKKFARGSYNPITGQVQWIYRSTNESDVTSRYNFDSALTFSMFTQAFYPWTLPTSGPQIHDVTYVVGPGGVSSPLPVFKYHNSLFSAGNYFFSFAEERDNVNWKDWVSTGSPVDYTSYFITGYRLHGDAQRKWQPGYVYIYSDNTQNTAYTIQGQWDYALLSSSGKFSLVQTCYNTVSLTNFSKVRRRHKIRGRGTVMQMQISSVTGKPFHIDGWSIWETQNAGV